MFSETMSCIKMKECGDGTMAVPGCRLEDQGPMLNALLCKEFFASKDLACEGMKSLKFPPVLVFYLQRFL